MSNESVFLPAAVRDRIWDLLKERKVTQAELATRIGCSESSLSRFISGKTDKLGDENIIHIARAFEVSTDFLLGEVDEPDRKNYDISEIGLSVEAARNLYTQKVNPKIVSYLLENRTAEEINHKSGKEGILPMAGEIFMRVNEVAEELGVSVPYAENPGGRRRGIQLRQRL